MATKEDREARPPDTSTGETGPPPGLGLPERGERKRGQSPKGRRTPEYRGVGSAGVYAMATLAFVLGVAFIVFLAQNTHAVELEWMVWSVSVSAAAMLLAALFVGAVLAAVSGVVWRHQRRRRLQEKEELKALRGSSR